MINVIVTKTSGSKLSDTMSKIPQKFKKVSLYLLLLLLSVLLMMSLTGCGGSENITSAGILTSGEVTLTWDDVPGADNYDVYLSMSPGITDLNSYKISDVANPITITDLEPGNTYFFVVSFEDDTGLRRTSKEISYKVTDTKGSIQIGELMVYAKPDAAVSGTEDQPEASPPKSKPVVKASPSASKPAVKASTSASKPAVKASASASKPAVKASSSASKPTAKATNPKTEDVTLAWDDVPNATFYNIYWSTKPGVAKKDRTRISNVKNPHKISGLIKGKKYYFVITAVNASGESNESEEFSLTVGQ